jgi:hypothetical protein
MNTAKAARPNKVSDSPTAVNFEEEVDEYNPIKSAEPAKVKEDEAMKDTVITPAIPKTNGKAKTAAKPKPKSKPSVTVAAPPATPTVEVPTSVAVEAKQEVVAVKARGIARGVILFCLFMILASTVIGGLASVAIFLVAAGLTVFLGYPLQEFIAKGLHKAISTGTMARIGLIGGLTGITFFTAIGGLIPITILSGFALLISIGIWACVHEMENAMRAKELELLGQRR